jgi:hypothetical protein
LLLPATLDGTSIYLSFFEFQALQKLLVSFYADSLSMNLRYAIDGCLDVTKCIVTKLQTLQTSPLAQIDLLTIEIDLPSDIEKFRHFGRHLDFLKRPTFENAITFEPFEISTPDRCHFAQD